MPGARSRTIAAVFALGVVVVAGGQDATEAEAIKGLREKGATVSVLEPGGHARRVQFLGGAFGDAEMRLIGRCPTLRVLVLRQTTASDAGLTAALAGTAGTLDELALYDDRFTDAAAPAVAGAKNLTTLSLGSGMSDATVASLDALVSLETVTLSGSGFTDAAVRQLARRPNLRSLSLWWTRVTGAGVADFAAAGKLSLLSIQDESFGRPRNAPVPPVPLDLKAIGAVKSLRSLDLRARPIPDADLAHLSGLTDLGTLTLSGSSVGDGGMMHLAALPKLRTVFLTGTAVGDGGLGDLARSKSLVSIYLDRTRVTDAGLKELAACPTLRSVFAAGTKVTPAGADALRRALPRCEVRLK